MNYHIYADGSFDIQAGSIRITGAYPAVDGIPLRAMSVTAESNAIRYALMAGEIMLRFDVKDSVLALHAVVKGLETAHDISLIHGGRIVGCDRSFVQGLGMEGPSGFAPMDGRDRDSHGLIAFGSNKQCMAVYACDHTRMHNFYHLNGNSPFQ